MKNNRTVQKLLNLGNGRVRLELVLGISNNQPILRQRKYTSKMETYVQMVHPIALAALGAATAGTSFFNGVCFTTILEMGRTSFLNDFVNPKTTSVCLAIVAAMEPYLKMFFFSPLMKTCNFFLRQKLTLPGTTWSFPWGTNQHPSKQRKRDTSERSFGPSQEHIPLFFRLFIMRRETFTFKIFSPTSASHSGRKKEGRIEQTVPFF
jgi:hypothetical protein